MNTPLFLPLLIPLLAATLSLLCRRWLPLQRGLAVLSTGALLLAGLWLLALVRQNGFVVLQAGNWQAPFGITLVADLLSALLVVLTGLVGFCVALYALVSTPTAHEKWAYYPLMHGLLAGVVGAFLTGDLFNLYVWFELLLLSSFALLTLGGERAQMEGAIKYVTLNLLASALFLSAIGLLYGMVGTLNLAQLGARLAAVPHQGLVNAVAMLFIVAFGIKAAAFPLFFWLPASYHTPQVAVSALFAGLLSKIGVYALYRLFTLVFIGHTAYTHNLLLWMAVLTMVTGVLGAAAQFEFRRILAFHSVSQIGYMLLGLALYSPLALAGGLFYILHHGIVKTNLFLISGLSYRLLGSYELSQLGGIYRARPWLSLLFLVSALSLAGLPPLSGFVAKLMLVQASLAQQAWLVTFFTLGVGLLTLYSMVKIWAEVFWKATPDTCHSDRLKSPQPEPGAWLLYTPVALLALSSICLGLLAQPVYSLLEQAAVQLLEPGLYIQAVLGGLEP